ncbi:hypothetical protein ACH4OY_22395, partial [Micromonospora rubida]
FAVSKDRAVAVSHLRNTPITGKSYTTSLDATHRSPAPAPGHASTLAGPVARGYSVKGAEMSHN